MSTKSNSEVGRLARIVANRMRQRIVTSHRPGERLPSEASLAGAYDCSVKTVRSALSVLADQGIVQRVHGSGTFVSDPLPLASRTTGLLFFGHATSLLGLPYYREALMGVLEATNQTKQEVHVLLGRQSCPVAVTSRMLDGLSLERFNSLICLEVFNPDLLEQLARRMITVSVDFACHRPGVSSCVLDHRQPMGLIVDQLWALGHRRIGYAGATRVHSLDPAHHERFEAFKEAMDRRALPLDEEWLLTHPTDHIVLQMERIVRLPAGRRPTAIICVDVPWQAAEVLTRLGLRIPADISLLSIGTPMPWTAFVSEAASKGRDWDVAVTMTGRPPDPLDSVLAPLRSMMFSGVNLPFEAMGAWAMREVLRRLAEPETEPGLEVFQSTLLSGTTLGPPAG